MNYISVLVMVLFPVASWADEVFKSPPELAIGSLVASLLLVLLCIFVFAFLIKKSNLIRSHKNHSVIKVLARQALTSKGQVQIIEVNKKRYLLGVTEQNISLLDTLPICENERDEVKTEQTSTPFATLLSKISIKRNE
ncbi:MAG: flagellar biosynthetic protein FliO [Psychromonas sp.]